MKYFILSLSSISNSFSIFESGDKIRFKYHYSYNGVGDLDDVSQNDFILGYKRGINLIKYVFKIIEVNLDSEELILEKILESNNGINIDDAKIIEKFGSQEIIKIDESQFINLYNELLNNLNIFDNENSSSDENNKEFDEELESKRLDCGKNTLIYGVPGVGKSWTINKIKCKNIDEHHKERIVFHQDYTYSDFVGQILPKVSEKSVEYEFVPGPFTNILKKSYINPSEKYVLIIEEINRGNAPAIFGDIFQLLDRMKKQTGIFKKGTSEFGITNSEIADEVYNNKEHKVRIPSNLSIIATMNTSDQNVFTLDTAFKRRWHMEMIKNDFDEPSFSGEFVPKSEITWKVFGTAINEIILEESNSTLSSEDKRLGAYFVDEGELNSPEEFAEKVLMYLWDDVFKFSREDFFNKESVDQFCLESIIDEYIKNEEMGKFKIFTNRINDKIKEVNERLSNDKEENDRE